MSKIKTLTSGLTAIALVGGIGFAYAQATDPATPPSTTQQQQMPSSTTPAETPNTAPSATPGADSTTTPSSSQPMANEPAPQADRN